MKIICSPQTALHEQFQLLLRSPGTFLQDQAAPRSHTGCFYSTRQAFLEHSYVAHFWQLLKTYGT